jgi:alpha-tubulin suppressor-like RCC1 family protein
MSPLSTFAAAIRRSPRSASFALRLPTALLALAGTVCSMVALGTPQASAAIVIPSEATAVSAGGEHQCALMQGGTVECWGQNGQGQLGDGSTANSETPVRVAGLGGAVEVSAGGIGGTIYGYTCARLAGGSIKCWGDGEQGQLGNGGFKSNTAPVAVSGIADAVEISTGGSHACARLSSGGVECWGEDFEGELGDGGPVGAADRATPVAVSGISTAIALDSDREQTCALLASGEVACWGFTGLETTTSPKVQPGIATATAVATGAANDCVLLAAGTVKCWGGGILGDGEYGSSATPVDVLGVSEAVAISTGGDSACALLAGSRLMCWGNDLEGELGVGPKSDGSVDYATPVVSGIAGALAISVGDNRTCALLGGGVVECTPLGEEPEKSATPTPPQVTTSAQVTITKHPPTETPEQTAVFGFKGVAGGSYECSLDDGAWSLCKGGQSLGPLVPGDHLFQVREKLNGITGPAASYRWTIDLPRPCVLKVARARVFAFTRQSRTRLVIHYKAYKPARVTVSYSLTGTRGGLAIGTASSHFKTAGIFRLGEKLDKADIARLPATTSMKVRFSVPQAPTSCTRYYTKRLTIPKKVFGQTVWFQSDSIFTP